MNRWQSFGVLAAALCLTAGGAFASTVQSGNIVMDSSDIHHGPSGSAPVSMVEVLVNPGFETGALAPWTQAGGWSVVNTNPHSGTFCAFDIGNNWVRQDFAPINTSQVSSVTFWSRQPEAQIQAVDFYYSDTTFDEFLVFIPTTWQLNNVTSNLRPAGALLTGIRIWGYSGGPGGPDETFVDDVSVNGAGATPVGPSTWGKIKANFTD
jgi:hypothetical protein